MTTAVAAVVAAMTTLDRAAPSMSAADGARVEINGNDIEVVHASGIKEEIENGRFEMKDASGRTIVERPATAADIARLAGFAQ